MKWATEDLPFLRKQRDFCAEYMLKGLDLRDAGLIWVEAIKDVERKNTKGTSQRKIAVRWC